MARRKRGVKANSKWRRICASRNEKIRLIRSLPEHVPKEFLPRNLTWTKTEPHISYRPKNLLHECEWYEGCSYTSLKKFIHDAIQQPTQWKRPAQLQVIEDMKRWRAENVVELGLSLGKEADDNLEVQIGEDVFTDYPAGKTIRSDLQDTFQDQPRRFDLVESLKVTIRNEAPRRRTIRKVAIKKDSNLEIAVLLQPYFVLG